MDEREKQRRRELVETIIRKCDLNQDGYIDFQEFLQAAVDYNSMLNKENITIAFGMFDLDNDGQISMDELKRVLSAQPPASKAMYATNATPSTTNFSPYSEADQEQAILEEIIKSVDKDGSNKISFDEFNVALTKYLEKSAQIEQREMRERESRGRDEPAGLNVFDRLSGNFSARTLRRIGKPKQDNSLYNSPKLGTTSSARLNRAYESQMSQGTLLSSKISRPAMPDNLYEQAPRWR